MPSESAYTHGHHASVLRSHRARTVENSAHYLIPYLEAGKDLLDVGCGPGTITVDFARRLGPGDVLGIDSSSEVIELARAEPDASSLANLRYEVANVYEMPFADHSFDLVHAHQVLQHLGDPVAALAEMRRVAKPDGVVAARDSDYAAMTWYPADPVLDRWLELYHDVARSNGAEPDAGRHLLAWARAAGFSTVQASASAWCYATPETRAWWGGLWAERIVDSSIAEQARERGLATDDELRVIAEAFTRWSGCDDGWFAVLLGEVICRP